MTELRQVDNKQLLQELQQRIQANQLSEKEVARILRSEEWKRAFRLADADPERQKEIEEWNEIQEGNEEKLADAYKAWSNDPNEWKDIKEKY